MITSSLQQFCDHIVTKGAIAREDVRNLLETVMPFGAATREDVDMLVALDRAVADQHPSWGDVLVATCVEYAVWTERATGRVGADAAAWLKATIGCGSGPTANGARVVVEAVREAESVDESLVAFALDANRWLRAPQGALAARPAMPLAA